MELILNNHFPSVLSKLIIEYVPKCYDCGKFIETLYECAKCKIFRCNFHNLINSDIFQCVECNVYDEKMDEIYKVHRTKCIYCDGQALFGYANAITLCYDHAKIDTTKELLYIYDTICDIVPHCVGIDTYIDINTRKLYCNKHACIHNIHDRWTNQI